MARRKRHLDEGNDSDSSVGSDDDDINDFGLNENPDERAERELFEQPYGRKKRRKANGKDDATYGIFGEDSEDEGFGGRGKKPVKRSDWTKAPAFISGEKKVDISEENEKAQTEPESEPEQEPEIQEVSMSDSNGDESEAASPPASPRVRLEDDEAEMDIAPRIGGIGSKHMAEGGTSTPSFSSSGIGFGTGGFGISKGGIGSNKGGIGSSSRAEPVVGDARSSLPSAFGASRPQRSFVRDGSGSAPGTRPSTPLNAAEQVHFTKLSGTFGAKMLSKMGWQAGQGLGTEGQGIVAPVESKLRPKGMGIAFKGFKEKTEQSKAEARRRGEAVSEDEEEISKKHRKKGKAKDQVPREDAWRKPRKSKIKVEHKTYEEIIAEAGGEPPPTGIGKIIDATGAELREVSSLADVSIASWTPSTDPMRLPEVRHNLRLITEACKVDLDGLAREAKALEERKKWIQAEDPRLRKKIEGEAELIRRLQAVHLVVDDISTKAKEADLSDYEPSLDVFSAVVEKLISEFSKEYDRYRLDEVVVGAIVPTFRRMMASWRPLDEPTAFTSTLRRWRQAFKMTVVQPEADMQVDVYGTQRVSPRPLQVDVPMTPYESLLWNIWLPRIRSTVNNDWSPSHPAALVKLYEAWSDVLPLFIKDNILDQLILPKVSSAISNWSPRRSEISLQAIVFPWLPHVGLRMEMFVDDARRKVKSMLRSWTPSEGVPKDFLPWKEIFNAKDWEDMLLKYVVPKLGALLRDEFRINPRNQDMEPLKNVLAWSSILRSSITGQLLETEFFPKWLDVLYIWLIQPSVNFEEVAQWYQFWKTTFPEDVRSISAVEGGFTRGLQMINHALELGPEAPTKLPKPDHTRRPDTDSKPSMPKDKKDTATARVRPARAQEITFREIVEEFVTSHNLLFMPAGKVHEKSRMPLFRVSKSVDGKGGLLVYLLDDAVWAPGVDGEETRAITLEDMVLRAAKGR
ncbi:TFP11-domain-containing protein [Fomitiporia mediterranea MF3/22]|uniref:TFP11-domain-containing protein n=1 Tax=Fomitiporia mediterranea (strain MF3/22) TaxID=694068 RepID=UPI000440794F|nr:TFP11-domain-containing protein [Fomitiporia mediterranea MF3/22]EJD07266.1 TFP11-domain-containing protein [Fomitiporia mediterranea MF3/22]